MSFNFTADPLKRRHKIVIKYIFALRNNSSKSNTTNFAILTNDDRYIEYELDFQQKDITKFVAKRIRSLFNPYQITSETEVVFNSEYDKNEILYMYMMFLQQHMQFNLRTVTIETILRGIVAYHQSYLKVHGSKINKNFTNKIWNKLIQTKRCPWITESFDNIIKHFSWYKNRDKKILRLGMYYIVIKNYFNAIKRRSMKKHEEISLENNVKHNHKCIF